RDLSLIRRDDDWFSDPVCGAGGALYVADTRRVELSSAFRCRRRDASVSLLSRMGGLRVCLVGRCVVSCASQRPCITNYSGDDVARAVAIDSVSGGLDLSECGDLEDLQPVLAQWIGRALRHPEQRISPSAPWDAAGVRSAREPVDLRHSGLGTVVCVSAAVCT